MKKINKKEAGLIVRKHILRDLRFGFRISSKPPMMTNPLYEISLKDEKFKGCWFISYSLEPWTLDGSFRLLCVSKKTGRVILDRVCR